MRQVCYATRVQGSKYCLPVPLALVKGRVVLPVSECLGQVCYAERGRCVSQKKAALRC